MRPDEESGSPSLEIRFLSLILRARDGDRTRKGKIPETRINTGMLINTTLPGYQK